MEPVRRVVDPKQEEAWVDAIRAARHPPRRDRTAGVPDKDPARAGARETVGVPAGAGEKATVGSNTKKPREVKLCQDLIEQDPWALVP